MLTSNRSRILCVVLLGGALGRLVGLGSGQSAWVVRARRAHTGEKS